MLDSIPLEGPAVVWVLRSRPLVTISSSYRVVRFVFGIYAFKTQQPQSPACHERSQTLLLVGYTFIGLGMKTLWFFCPHHTIVSWSRGQTVTCGKLTTNLIPLGASSLRLVKFELDGWQANLYMPHAGMLDCAFMQAGESGTHQMR